MARLVGLVAFFLTAYDVFAIHDVINARAAKKNSCGISNPKAGLLEIVIDTGRSATKCNPFAKAENLKKTVKAEHSHKNCNCKVGPHFGIELISFLASERDCTALECLRMHTELAQLKVVAEAGALNDPSTRSRVISDHQSKHRNTFYEDGNWVYTKYAVETASTAVLEPFAKVAQTASNDGIVSEAVYAIHASMGLLTDPDPKVELARVHEQEIQNVAVVAEIQKEALLKQEAVVAEPVVVAAEEVIGYAEIKPIVPEPVVEQDMEVIGYAEVKDAAADEAERLKNDIEEKIRIKIEDEMRENQKEIRRTKMLTGLHKSLQFDESHGMELLKELKEKMAEIKVEIDKLVEKAGKADAQFTESDFLFLIGGSGLTNTAYMRMLALVTEIQGSVAHLQALRLVDDFDRSEKWERASETLKNSWEFQLVLVQSFEAMLLDNVKMKGYLMECMMNLGAFNIKLNENLGYANEMHKMSIAKVEILSGIWEQNRQGTTELEKMVNEELKK